MRYQNAACVSCNMPFGEKDTVVVCPVCGAPHHAECWAKEGKCACEEKHASGFVWDFPAPEPPVMPETAVVPGAEANAGDTVPCEFCGARVYRKAMFCPQCGNPLKSDVPRGEFRRYDDPEPNMDRILENYEKYGGLDPDAEIDGVPCRDYSDFVGGSFPGRILRKAAEAERRQSKISWSFAACLFGPIWFLYRKMVKEGVALLLIHLILTFSMLLCMLSPTMIAELRGALNMTEDAALNGSAENYAEIVNEMQSALESALYSGLSSLSQGRLLGMRAIELIQTVAVPVLCGLFGLWFYRKKVRADVLNIRASQPDPIARQVRFRKSGGTSVGYAVLGILGYAVVYIVFANILFSLL